MSDREACIATLDEVFLTNNMPPVRRKLRIDSDDLRERNPQVIIARGSVQGPTPPTPKNDFLDHLAKGPTKKCSVFLCARTQNSDRLAVCHGRPVLR